ncbi:unnamed protein product [Peronospora destructor]|uniref:B box-type domain-containing protein n=1 Tax=Peronospora destructor TaxID=86335 RepID=A0AAV0V199_9STRA|nr:unnamed protein product [Peronospora destructor]
MQGDEPLSVASTDALLVSPPAQMIEEIFVSDVLATSFKLSAPTSSRASQSTPDTTAKGSFARQKTVLKADDKVKVQTSDTKQKRMWNTANKNKVEEKNKDKMWFDMLPVVLENIKTYNREHVRQLSLPRCIKCARVRDAHKAVIRCTQKDCIVLDRPLCLMCWKSYHESLEARQHCGQNTSACPQCQLDWVVYWCAECDLNFCKKCFEQIHSVSATTSHRKIATEDAPGTCFVTSHWSATFQNMIVDMIASRKQKINSNPGGSTIGAKRTRNIEVIVIDEEEDEEERASQQNGSSTGEENELMRPSDADSQLQQDPSGNTDYQASTNEQSMLLVILFLQESAKTRSEPLASLSQQTGLTYSTSWIQRCQYLSSTLGIAGDLFFNSDDRQRHNRFSDQCYGQRDDAGDTKLHADCCQPNERIVVDKTCHQHTFRKHIPS